MTSAWTTQDIPDQTGRTIVVTGANSGIGLVAARELAAKGAHVVFACRDTAKAEAARAGLPGSHEVRRLDLADLDSVRSFAQDLADWRVDVLVNNAGIMNVPFARTPQGFESQFGTNVLGHFVLTARLLPRVTDRVVWLSSGAHRFGRIDLEDPNFEHRTYRGWTAYGQSKLADLMLAYELQWRLTGAGSTVRSVAAHPGYSATNLQTHSGTWQDAVGRFLNRFPAIASPPEAGALPTLYAATEPDLPGGSYVGPGGPGELQGPPRLVSSSAASHNREVARGLWDLCERLTGEAFTV
jgi:NAD(P)-dependent dehydrogenase (short-subunit alcohol dehydrogenase family)